MAEWVSRNLEALLPQLEELEHSGIFSREEIRRIARCRRQHEYSMRRRPPNKADYLRAIKYEMNLDLLRRHRKKKLGIVTTRKDAEFGIQNRIDSLYRRVLRKFKSDMRLWLQYVEFSKRCLHFVSLSKTFGKVLAIHPHIPGLWVMAAKFKFEELKDASSARALLQQGLRSNRTSKHLWREYFRMELMHTDKIRKRRALLGLNPEEDKEVADVTDDFLAYKVAMVVYKQAVKAIPGDLSFRLSFLQLLRLFENTEEREEEIYEDVRLAFPTHPQCWDALARKEWVDLDPAALTDSELRAVEGRTEDVFREGLTAVQEDSHQLWECYVCWCKERATDKQASKQLRAQSVHRLLAAFRDAFEAGVQTESLYLQSIETLHQLDELGQALEVAAMATKHLPHSSSLWLARMKCFSLCNRGNKSNAAPLMKLYRKALAKANKETALPLWQSWIQEGVLHKLDGDQIADIFLSGIESGAESVRTTLALQFIDWSLLTTGIKQTRKVYRRLLKKRPIPYSVYVKCCAVEQSGENPSMRHLRELFEKAVADYGSEIPDLWLDYIKAERSLAGGDVGCVAGLHWRASKSLRPELVEEFSTLYSLLQTAL